MRFLYTLIFITCVAAKAAALDSDQLKSGLKSDFTGDTCVESTKECLSLTDEAKKEGCLTSTIQSGSCQNSPLSALVSKRVKIISDPTKNKDILDPQLLDKKCVINFDNLLSAQLIKADRIAADIEKLEDALQSCIQDKIIQIDRQ